MEIVLALLQASAALLPQIQQVMPIVQSLINGQKVTSQQMADMWQAIATLEAQNAALAAKVEQAAAQ